MLRRFFLLLVALSFLCSPVVAHANSAAAPKNKGLFITPLRSYISVQPRKTASGTFTIANITDAPITVTLSVEQFSVADYTYDYQFTQTHEDWVKLSQTQAALQPGKSQNLNFTLAPPTNAIPGGHYFTIFAAAHLQKNNASEVRAATVLYVTVEGAIRKASSVNSTHIPFFAFGSDIAFSLDVKNTGNTHFFAYTSGKLEGLLAQSSRQEVTDLLLPGTSRIIGSSIPAPLLPGVYKAVFGYRTDDNQTIQRSAYVVYVPPWAILIPIGVVWLIFAERRYRRSR